MTKTEHLICLPVPVCWLQLPGESVCVQDEVVYQSCPGAVGFNVMAKTLQHKYLFGTALLYWSSVRTIHIQNFCINVGTIK